LKIVRRALLLCAVAAGLAGTAPAVHAQSFGIGGSAGVVNDVSGDVEFSGFQWGDANGWFEYKLEKWAVFRLTYGNIWTQQSLSESVQTTPEGPVTVPELDENVRYGIVSVSYLFWEGYFTSGLFAGFGGYGMRPGVVPAGFQAYADPEETVIGWHAGADGEFQVTRQVGIVLRFTYHNVSAHPHRQFVTADGGAVFRF
jgi:hypothetical protein